MVKCETYYPCFFCSNMANKVFILPFECEDPLYRNKFASTRVCDDCCDFGLSDEPTELTTDPDIFDLYN